MVEEIKGGLNNPWSGVSLEHLISIIHMRGQLAQKTVTSMNQSQIWQCLEEGSIQMQPLSCWIVTKGGVDCWMIMLNQNNVDQCRNLFVSC